MKKENDTPDPDCTNQVNNSKKIPDLERTVFVLKRVVEKLQVENKRLLSGKRPCSERLVINFIEMRGEGAHSFMFYLKGRF